LEREAYCSPPSSSEFKNVGAVTPLPHKFSWRYVSTETILPFTLQKLNEVLRLNMRQDEMEDIFKRFLSFRVL
jgi:hypothetical protein